MKVCKFGGSSLADAAQINKVIDIVLADPARRIVVVSAPGKRSSGDTKVTDLLIGLAETALRGEDVEAPRAAVLERYASMARDLKLGDEVVAGIEKEASDCRGGDFVSGQDDGAEVEEDQFFDIFHVAVEGQA